jgi:glycerol uptake facilitator-like aquaporin
MVKDQVLTFSSFFNDLVDFTPPGLVLSFAAGNVADRKYFDVYVKEFIGSMLMIAFTFSAGKWVGQDSIPVAWAFHAIGVIAADYFGGGQQVNPAVTMSMWALGKCNYTEAFVRVAGQMGGGLISFPLFHALAEALNWTPLGGPEFSMEANADAAISEFVATFLLMWAIYVVSLLYIIIII